MEFEPLTRKELIKQGSCCGSGCKNCPYVPKNGFGATKLDTE